MDNPESQDYDHEISNLESMLDALPVSERGVVMQRLRDALTASSGQLSVADENVCDQFARGAINIRQVEEHFGDRLWRAFGLRPDAGDASSRSTDTSAKDPAADGGDYPG